MKYNILFLILIYAIIVSAQDFWQPTNGPLGVDINCMVKNDSGYIFIGTNQHGIFHSTNNGQTWVASNDGLNSSHFRDIIINSNGNIFAVAWGIYRSVDNGNNWTAINNGLSSLNVSCLAINNDGHIFAGTIAGLYRSIDNGENWSLITINPLYHDISSIAINDLGHIFVGTHSGGIFRSTNNGQSWINVHAGIQYTTVGAIKVKPNGHIYASTSYAGNILSKDNGQTWISLNFYTRTYTFAFDSSGRVFAATSNGIYYSDNNGSTWTQFGGIIKNTIVNTIVIKENGEIFAGTMYSGILWSSNAGITWSMKNNGLSFAQITSMYLSINGDIFAGTRGVGIQYSTDLGTSWNVLDNDFPLNWTIRTIIVNATGDIFTGISGHGVLRSIDGGQNWTFINNGLTNTDINCFGLTNSGDILTGTNDGLFLSTNNGDNWVNTSIQGVAISAIVLNDSGNIFVGTYGEHVYCSNDDGNSWISLNTGLAYSFVNTIDFNNDGHVYISAWDWEEPNHIPTTYYYYGIFKSNDNGNNWFMIKDDFNIDHIVVDKANNIYGSTYLIGVYRSNDNGISWDLINNGLPNKYVTGLLIDNNSYLYAGTLQDGVYRSLEQITNIQKEPSGFIMIPILYQNYPNPFNPTTTIEYYLPRNQHVEIILFNTLGQQVKTFYSGVQNSGNHQVEINAENLPSGIYYYQLKTEEFQNTKKCLLLK